MTPQRVRELTGWPPEVPEEMILSHLGLAQRQFAQRLPGVAPSSQDAQDAISWLAAASLAPLLHAFALSGAAKVGRLEGAVEWRFLTPVEAQAFARHCQDEAEKCISRLAGMQAAWAIFLASV
ncbi:hypothetical protein [Tepidiphilus succinatimandens]|uniref:hypothetical protein n=1 Tax=Tepidiphilus succinatimandens TaxID=224436 RepID=UPI00112F585A|nr:hypothetical protein [Tepidiphilus succinatimandens]